MGAEYTFYDYVEDGVNVIHLWLNGEGKAAKAKFNNWLGYLEATPPGGWTRPYVDTLTGVCAGLFEIRVGLKGLQYRILGSHMGGDRTPTLLHCFIKPDAKVEPIECDRAKARKAKVEADRSKFRVEHDNGK
jgi:hypothetical protein